MQRGPAFGARPGFNFGANGGVGAGHVVQPVKQCLEVQHGAAHQQRQLAASVDVGDEPRSVSCKFSRAVGMQRVADIDQVVRHAGQLSRRRLGRADVHAPVHQRRIDADDFDLHHPGNGKGGGCFARCGGARQRNAARGLNAARVRHMLRRGISIA